MLQIVQVSIFSIIFLNHTLKKLDIATVSIACNCLTANTNGASANCDASGQCDCVANTYGTTCILCDCNTGGTENGSGECDSSSGVCTCKEGIVNHSIFLCVLSNF